MEPPNHVRLNFGEVSRHRAIGDIIRRYSTNPDDVYRFAFEGLAFPRPVRVLDLGCGYGAFTAALKGIAPPGSRAVGIDWIESNRDLYLEAACAAGMEGRFVCGPAAAMAELHDGDADLVLAGFSLYFFVDALPGIRRVLAEDGLFVAITHSEETLRELLVDIRAALGLEGEISPEAFGIEEVLAAFSAENGREKLMPHFGEITRRAYPNRLRFPADRMDDCFAYIDFKRGILTPRSPYRDTVADERTMRALHEVIRAKAAHDGSYTLTKDDAVFLCRGNAKEEARRCARHDATAQGAPDR